MASSMGLRLLPGSVSTIWRLFAVGRGGLDEECQTP